MTIKEKQTDELICPYCNSEYEDIWQIADIGESLKCKNCNKQFIWERIILIQYKSYKNGANNEM